MYDDPFPQDLTQRRRPLGPSAHFGFAALLAAASFVQLVQLSQDGDPFPAIVPNVLLVMTQLGAGIHRLRERRKLCMQ